MRFSGFESLLDQAKSLGRAKVAVAAAADKEVLEAIMLAEKEGLITPILVGDTSEIKRLAYEIGFNINGVELIHASSLEVSAHNAVDAVVDGQAHFLMKGQINSADFLRAVLRPVRGLRTERLLSHLSAFQVPGFSRLLFVTDGGGEYCSELGTEEGNYGKQFIIFKRDWDGFGQCHCVDGKRSRESENAGHNGCSGPGGNEPSRRISGCDRRRPISTRWSSERYGLET